ncbi:MAG: hypothetical protein ACK53Y_19605, partial [bacterium]
HQGNGFSGGGSGVNPHTSIPRLPQPPPAQPKPPDPPTNNKNRHTPTIPHLPNNDIRGKLAEPEQQTNPQEIAGSTKNGTFLFPPQFF